MKLKPSSKMHFSRGGLGQYYNVQSKNTMLDMSESMTKQESEPDFQGYQLTV